MRKLNLTIIAGLVAAVLGAAVVIAYGRGVDNRIADGKQRMAVLVAKQDIPAGTAAAALGSYVEVAEVPQAYLVDRPMRTLADAPPATFLLGPVSKGGQLSAADFGAAPSAAGGPAIAPAKGKVAIAIQVGVTPGVAKYVSPGSTVDIFFTAGGGSSAKGGAAAAASSRTKLFASGLRVLAVTIAPPPSQQSKGQSGAAGQQSVGDSVLAVLEVDPQVAEKIVNATQNGSLYLALDAKGDTHTTPTGATPADVLNSNK